MERIVITGLELFAYHGCNPEERRDGQMFLLDIELLFDGEKACRSDSLSDTVNYAKVIRRAAAVFTEQPCNLIEHVAWRTAAALLDDFAPIERITIRVHKPDAPIQTPFADIAFELTRDKRN